MANHLFFPSRPLPPKEKHRHGFTLIEIMTVLVIIAIVTALMVPVVNSARYKIRLSRAQADIRKIEAALNLFQLDYGLITPNNTISGVLLDRGDYMTILNINGDSPVSPSSKQPYLSIPNNQMNNSTREFLDPWKQPYRILWTPTHNRNTYDVYSLGPNGIDEYDPNRDTNGDDITNWSRQ